jgi:hypothetical protein
MPKRARRAAKKPQNKRQSFRYPLGLETLQRDAAALYSFVDSICAHAYEDRRSAQYLDPSKRFFAYVRELGDGTKAYLNTFAAKAPRDRRLYQDYRQKLETIRSGWFELHELIKPAIDADTLSIPYTLVEALTRRLGQIAGFEKTGFAIFHFDELNYLEMPVSEIKKTTDRLERIIPDPPVFPERVGLIGIPYSQSSSIYLNCLISHEIGHFVFGKLKLKNRVLPELQKSLQQALGPNLAQITSDDLDRLKDRLDSWAEEIFCDLFAVWLIGPCYALTYVELFGLTTILDPTEASGFKVTAGSIVFTRSHPADLFRLKQQVLLLQKLGWWDEVNKIKSHYVDVLRSATNIPPSGFTTIQQNLADETLKAFLALCPFVMKLLAEVMKDFAGKPLESGLGEYKTLGESIGHYLERAVVPSTVLVSGNHWYPSTVALLNASMKFYLESLEELMNGIEGQKTSLAGHRSRWIKRLESLVGKSIEDHHLLVDEEGAVPVGSAFKRADLRSLE